MQAAISYTWHSDALSHCKNSHATIAIDTREWIVKLKTHYGNAQGYIYCSPPTGGY
jgi:hypothetical protein